MKEILSQVLHRDHDEGGSSASGEEERPLMPQETQHSLTSSARLVASLAESALEKDEDGKLFSHPLPKSHPDFSNGDSNKSTYSNGDLQEERSLLTNTEFDEKEIEPTDRSSHLGNLAQLLANFVMPRISASPVGASASDAASDTAVIQHPTNTTFGQILDVYPDRNPGEKKFPHIGNSQNSPELQHFYDGLRAFILRALNDDNFRGGHFKYKFTPDRSVLSIILGLAMSSEVSKDQYNVFFRFGRAWSKAIAESSKWEKLDNNFIVYAGLEYASMYLVDMFAEEKSNPLPYPLPDNMKYHDPKTRREKSKNFSAK